ncbi:ferredoxin [Tropicimonas sediminicola]|uniref:Ferredoxin n=1 Tax=Tropicimonas sediminicola TaxID=1031541 RepID=A0A239JW59_9RHOB|nr:hypothetical protein [Tropicimonas sediminicola]SNT09782.1 hypothetical protein SAMN05421757_10690 [Tropicimonas sediminicola]
MQQAQFANSFPSIKDAAPASVSALRPALFARYGALSELRHDYPLVLVDEGQGATLLRPLSRIIDDILKAAAAPGADGEAMRQQVLKLEARIRRAVNGGRAGRLSALWRTAAAEMVKESGEAPFGPLDSNLDAARRHLDLDGEVIGCNAETPARVVTHAWKARQDAKARRFRKRVESLILRLSDILKSDHMKSHEAHGAEALASAMGRDVDGSIDFDALSGVLERARPEDRLPEDRVKRIRHALEALRCQPFFGPGRASQSCPKRPEPYNYTFTSVSDALNAHRARLPDVLEFTKAMTVAELEVDNKYRPELHDPVFARFDESDLTAEQMDLLPSALICLRDGVTVSAEIARAYEALACGLPITVLIQVDDLLGPTAPEPPRNSFGAGTTRLASMAMGLNNAFVFQAASAHLFRMCRALRRGMDYDGPALFCIYSGATPSVRGVAPYVLSAAATEARVFPNFTYDPAAGADLASRFDLSVNPQCEADWPEHVLDYEDREGQGCRERIAFSFADFAICDARYQRFCHAVPQDGWTPAMMPTAEHLAEPDEGNAIESSYVLGIDPENRLFRVVVDAKIVEAALRCNDAWRRLLELAGVNNSHALRLLAAERKAREAAERKAEAEPEPALAPEPAPAVAEAPPVAAEPADEGAADGVPWIETARCTTCNECTQVNSAMFRYNENMQAYIADPDAGTYRQLVEAAEGCQVSIIHPGQPRNPDEPNLAELIERAAPFA